MVGNSVWPKHQIWEGPTVTDIFLSWEIGFIPQTTGDNRVCPTEVSPTAECVSSMIVGSEEDNTDNAGMRN